ncbi:hypothetical protein MMC25_006031 [Agyrium rufum]|nr:hypothetical protein [Agyrium rufum]
MSHFEALPMELVEHIVTYLDFGDIASLRLTCSNLARSASQRKFRSFLKHKNIRLTIPNLQAFVYVTSHHRLGCLLEQCTLTGIWSGSADVQKEVYGKPQVIEEHEDTEEHDELLCKLLTEAFNNLKRSEHAFTSLRLRVAACDERVKEDLSKGQHWVNNRIAIWKVAQRTFDVAMDALTGMNQSVLRELDFFDGVERLAIYDEVFFGRIQKPSMKNTLGLLKSLKVRLSTRLSTTQLIGDDKTRTPELTLSRLRQVSHMLPNLETLDLHWFGHVSANCYMGGFSPNGLDTNTELGFPRLEHCVLRGVYAIESELLQFLKAHRLMTLKLANFNLISGTWSSVFACLVAPNSSITLYDLDDVFEGTHLVHFYAPGSSKFPCANGGIGPSNLRREGTHVKDPIRYHTTSGTALGSWQYHVWTRQRVFDYGHWWEVY